MDPDQTAPTGADQGPHCLSTRLKYFSGRHKKIHFVIMRFKG